MKPLSLVKVIQVPHFVSSLSMGCATKACGANFLTHSKLKDLCANFSLHFRYIILWAVNCASGGRLQLYSVIIYIY